MTVWQAVLLGTVEGITEFLPISSTAHLLLLQRFLHLQGSIHLAFAIVVQLGALLAAGLHYRRIWGMAVHGLITGSMETQRWWLRLGVATVPILLLGALLGAALERWLSHPIPIALALAIGGALMIVVDWTVISTVKARESANLLPSLSWREAIIIGLTQTLALWPGMSRSGSCFVGARLAGVERARAVHIAFLLAFPALGAATLYKLLRCWRELLGLGWMPLLMGCLTSFVVGWLVVAWLLRVFQRIGLVPFGIYRLVLAGVVVLGMFW